MRHAVLAAALLLLGPLAGARGEEATAGAPPAAAEILPLEAVRPGMRGIGYTVKEGTRLATFEVEVLDVLRHFLPKQDVILVRCHGPGFASHRVARGMSGSPVYVEGRLVGALAYTWGWALEPLGGVTPIEAMLAEGRRPLEGRPTGAEPATPLRRSRPAPREGRALEPIGTGVGVSGFSPAGRLAVSEALAPFGLDVHAAGGGVAAGAPGGWANLDAPMAPGAALVIDLLRGDFAVNVLGTCTHVDGDTVYGFGHGFNDLGETLLPMSVGYVYTVVASREISFKLGGAVREVGAILQDRPSGVVGRLGARAPMVPFAVTLENAVTGRREDFRFEVTANRVFFSRLMLLALREAFTKAEATLGPNTKRYRLEVQLAGVATPWSYEDATAGFDSGPQRILIGLVDRVMNHDSQRADFEWVKLYVAIEHTDRRAHVVAVTASRDEVRPGEEVELDVLLRQKEGGGLLRERLTVRVPATLPPGNVSIRVTGGDLAPVDVAAPVDVLDVPALYDAFLKSTDLVAVVPTGRVHLDVDGRLLPDLPLSAMPRLARSLEGAATALRPVTLKVRRPVPYVVDGAATVSLRIVGP
jgi:hypothetical protein